MDPSHILYRRECYRWALRAPAAIRYHVAGVEDPVAVEATVEDLSAEGMGLLCRESLPADLPAEVFLIVDNRTYSAAVRITRTTPTPDGFHIGCEFVVRDIAG
jgi:hypothetical protein